MDKVGGEEGEGEMYGEKNTEIYKTTCETDRKRDLVYDSGNSNRGSCDRLNGGVGREMGGRSGREGTCVYLWLLLVDV